MDESVKGLNSWADDSVSECGVTLASPIPAAAHSGVLRRVSLLPGADRPLQAGQGGLPVLRPRALHALRGDQRGAHPTTHAPQPGLRCACGLGESWCGAGPAVGTAAGSPTEHLPVWQIMVGEGLLYCMQSRLWGRSGGPGGPEGSIHAGGCNFNSFLRRTVRFVGEFPHGVRTLRGAGLVPAPAPGPNPPTPQASTCSACVPQPW